jgi:hypothetical protein
MEQLPADLLPGHSAAHRRFFVDMVPPLEALPNTGDFARTLLQRSSASGGLGEGVEAPPVIIDHHVVDAERMEALTRGAVNQLPYSVQPTASSCSSQLCAVLQRYADSLPDGRLQAELLALLGRWQHWARAASAIDQGTFSLRDYGNLATPEQQLAAWLLDGPDVDEWRAVAGWIGDGWSMAEVVAVPPIAARLEQLGSARRETMSWVAKQLLGGVSRPHRRAPLLDWTGGSGSTGAGVVPPRLPRAGFVVARTSLALVEVAPQGADPYGVAAHGVFVNINPYLAWYGVELFGDVPSLFRWIDDRFEGRWRHLRTGAHRLSGGRTFSGFPDNYAEAMAFAAFVREFLVSRIYQRAVGPSRRCGWPPATASRYASGSLGR